MNSFPRPPSWYRRASLGTNGGGTNSTESALHQRGRFSLRRIQLAVASDREAKRDGLPGAAGDRWPDKDARTVAFEVFEDLVGLDWHTIAATRDRGADGDEDGLPYLRFTSVANERFVEWRTNWEKRLRSGDLSPALESHLAKYRKLVPGLALISHLVDVRTGCVGLPELERALAKP